VLDRLQHLSVRSVLGSAAHGLDRPVELSKETHHRLPSPVGWNPVPSMEATGVTNRTISTIDHSCIPGVEPDVRRGC